MINKSWYEKNEKKINVRSPTSDSDFTISEKLNDFLNFDLASEELKSKIEKSG